MEKEEIIKEMAKDLKEIETDVGHKLVKETFSYVKEHKKYNPKGDYSLAHIKTAYQLTAEKMIKRGWVKPDKDSVVLTREEADKIANEKFDFGRNSNKQYYENYVLPQARKEIIKLLIDSQILSTLMNELEIVNLFIKAHDRPNDKLLKKRENLIKLIDLIQENNFL